jgi:tetratricopeptide (TPR) repeat protein
MLAELSFMADDPLELQEQEARKALELNPNLADAHDILGQIAGIKGDLGSFVRHIEEAYQLDPLSPPTIRYLGRAYFFAGREQEALEHWKRTLHLDPITSYHGMADYYIAKGDLEQADAMVQEMERIGPTNRATYLKRGYLAALKGDKPTAMAMIAKLEATREKGWVTSPYAGYIYQALGETDKFFEYMFAAVKSHTLPVTTLLFSPLFADVRRDPRFEQVISLDRQLNM